MKSKEMCCDGFPSQLLWCSDISDKTYDGMVVVASNPDTLPKELDVVKKRLQKQKEVDSAFLKDVAMMDINLPCQRLIFTPTGPLNRDFDDVRRYSDAAKAGVVRALRAGCKSILLVRASGGSFPNADEATVLGAMYGLYNPLELREAPDRETVKAHTLGFWSKDGNHAKEVLKYTSAIEKGRIVSRDIGGSDPERMCPLPLAEYVEKTFANGSVKLSFERGQDHMEREYPMFAAVNRGSEEVERYKGCVINLEYTGEGPITDTLMLVGKGVTYDTGGHDLKVGGVMAGMSRDKCGAASVAGFFKVLDELRPKHIKAIGAIAIVRNCIGNNAFVADEIITSRVGRRVRIAFTDCEGRLATGDVLCKMRERAVNEVNPHLMTWATLTGHVTVAIGSSYSAVLDNGPARCENFAQKLQKAGEDLGDGLEISTIRREDYNFHTGRCEYTDLYQSDIIPTSRCQRGHQNPAAFYIMVSGLDKHGVDSDQPLKYTHIDLAGAGPFPHAPTGTPIPAMVQKFLYKKKA